MKRFGWFAVVVFGMLPASVAFGSRLVCETWRDFLYYRGNGAFLEWVGQPYQVCRALNDTREPPANELPGDRRGEGGVHGGRGDPVTSPCERCNDAEDAREAAAEKALSRCSHDAAKQVIAWCSAGNRRGRPQGPRIPQTVADGWERECEEGAGGRVRCRNVPRYVANLAHGQCVNEWILGFSDSQIAAGLNSDGQPIDTLPLVVPMSWQGQTLETLLGVDQRYQDLCDRPYNDALDIAEAHYEDCLEAVREVAQNSGDRAVNCQ